MSIYFRKLRAFKYYLFCLSINFTLRKLRCIKYYLFCLYINLIKLHGDNIFFMALLFVYVKVTLYSLKKQAKYHFYLKRKIGGRLTILVLHQYSIIFINYLLNDCVLKLKFKFEINNVVHNKEQLKRRNMNSFCNFLLLKYCFSFVRIISTNKKYNLMIERKNLNAE